MQPLDVISRLAEARTRTAKEAIIIDAYAANCEGFFSLMQLAADPFITFGVTKVAEILDADDAPGSLSLAEFRLLCDQLATRVHTGEAARNAIHAAAERCHVQTWNRVYRRVLLKDIAVIDAPTINRVLDRMGNAASSFRIPIFQGQIAASAGGKLSGLRRLDVKIPGTRLFTVLDQFATFHLETGAVIEDEYLSPSVHALAAQLRAPMVLDGVRTDAGNYVLFDLIPLVDFKARLCTKTQSERHTVLVGLQKTGAFAETRMIRVLPQLEIDFAQPDGKRACAEFCQIVLDQGYSTVMVKKPDAPYVGKKNTAWAERKARALLTDA